MNSAPPRPHLTGHDTHNRNEPSVVRDARILCILVMIISGIWILAGGFALASPDRQGKEVLMLPVGIGIFGVALWHFFQLNNRNSLAWGLQQVFSGLGLFAFPLGTIINVLILTKWYKPEVRAWFGMD
jgi:hypothetical protein